MAFLIDLWLPIVVAAVVVFVLSSVIHMVLPIHKGDYGRMPNEDPILDAIRESGVEPGTYSLPGCTSMSELADPEMQAKFERGPVGYVTILAPGLPAIGPRLLQWFALSIGIAVLAAYVGHHTLVSGAEASAVLRVTGCVAVAGFALGAIQDSIWKGVPWRISLKLVADGVVYGLAAGASFAWLWPAAA